MGRFPASDGAPAGGVGTAVIIEKALCTAISRVVGRIAPRVMAPPRFVRVPERNKPGTVRVDGAGA
jgi:hypothetical protein